MTKRKMKQKTILKVENLPLIAFNLQVGQGVHVRICAWFRQGKPPSFTQLTFVPSPQHDH